LNQPKLASVYVSIGTKSGAFMLNPGTAAAKIESVEKEFGACKPGSTTRLKRG
jgi:hypothetical protein